MSMARIIIITGFCALFFSVNTTAWAAANIPADLKSARIVFDSDRDRSIDKVNSIYLWEAGRISKIFKGAFCPRWSPEGDRIACVLEIPGKEGYIGILDRAGAIKTEIEAGEKAIALEWLGRGHIIYVAKDAGDTEFSRSHIILYELATNKERKLYSTQESGEIYQINWDKDRANLILDVSDIFPGSGELRRRTALLDLRTGGPLKMVYDHNAYKPALFHDGSTIVFQADLDIKGSHVNRPGTGVLAAYDISSGEWAGIRDALFVHNTRFSDDGKYFYSAEGEGDKSVVIRLFLVDDLERPVLRVSQKSAWPARAHKDLRPDLFISPAAASIPIVPVYVHGNAVNAVTTTHEKIAQNVVIEKTHIERPGLPVRPTRPVLSERVTWRPDPNTTATQRSLPEARRTLPQLDSEGGKTTQKMPTYSADKKYEPLKTAEDARQEVYMKEGQPAQTKLTSEANQPLQKGPKMYSEPNEYIPSPGGVVQTSLPTVPSGLPPGVRVPPGARPIPRGWVIETSLGDKITVEYAEDGSSYTVTEEGPNFNSKATYPVYGAGRASNN